MLLTCDILFYLHKRKLLIALIFIVYFCWIIYNKFMNKNDLRAQRTFHKINRHFKILMSTVGYQKINVAMITEKASMNRSTFYSHFKDKRDLYDYHLNLIIDRFDFYSIFDIGLKPFHNLSQEEQDELCDKMGEALTTFKEEKDFILAMMEVEDVHNLTKSYINHGDKDFRRNRETMKFKRGTVDVPVDLIINFGVGMFVSVIKWWLIEEPELTPREVGEVVLHIFYALPLNVEQPAQ